MKIVYDNDFDSPHDGKVFLIIPDVYSDERGYFTEVLKSYGKWPNNDMPLWFSELPWIRQINRSCSKAGTVRGCHAQSGVYCQAKLVEALNTKIYDIITDARPDSKSFGLTKAYILDPITLNKLFVPRGFLHGFAVPFGSEDAVFQYFCDNTFNKQSEIGINPMSILPDFVDELKRLNSSIKEYQELYELFDDTAKLLLSEKDCKALDFKSFMEKTQNEYSNNRKLWYQ